MSSPPRSRRPSRHQAAAPARPPLAAARPLSESEFAELELLLDQVPAPLEPLDASMLDGFLCGVLVQPQRIPVSRWLPHVTDADGRPLPAGFDATRLQALASRRHAELDDAIARRQWFDPWVFELHDEGAAGEPDSDDMPPSVDAVYPWVAGFATAMELFPALMHTDASALTEPLALLYRHLAPDDLEEADELLAEIESLEPPADLAEAVEGLVRATLLLADIARPVAQAPHRRPARGRAGR